MIYLVFAFCANSPSEILSGLLAIYRSPDILISDYIEIGGLGAALVNVALVGIFSTLLMKHAGCEETGMNLMAIWLMCGFAFFGKNPINILPIILGGYLYCRFQKISFANSLVSIFLATTLSPIVTQLSFVGLKSRVLAALIGIALGLLVGFIIIPVSQQTKKVHQGYNLYNVGFAAGIIAILLAAILRNLGIEWDTLSVWSSGNNGFLGLFLLVLCLYMVVGGYLLSDYSIKEYVTIKRFIAEDARSHDYFQIMREQCYQNMAFLGVLGGALVLFTGGQLNGPLLGGIFTIIGFAACGKNLFNTLPVVIGCSLAVFLNGWSLSTPSIMLAVLFSTTLSPIANNFGWLWGILAGFLHLNMVARLSGFHGGLSLYNNGLAGGLVATILVPIILALQDSPRVPSWLREYRDRKKEKRRAIIGSCEKQ